MCLFIITAIFIALLIYNPQVLVPIGFYAGIIFVFYIMEVIGSKLSKSAQETVCLMVVVLFYGALIWLSFAVPPIGITLLLICSAPFWVAPLWSKLNGSQTSRSNKSYANKQWSSKSSGRLNKKSGATGTAKRGLSSSSSSMPTQNNTAMPSSNKPIRHSDSARLTKAKNIPQHLIYNDSVDKKSLKANLSTKNASSVRLQDLPTFKKRNLLLEDIQDQRKEIESFAMEVVMGYEMMKGRKPVDVSKSNLGFDILSTVSSHSLRHIEVKGLSGEGDVILTPNELKAAEHHNDTYFVYVVENCSGQGKPQLYIMRGIKNGDLIKEVVDYEIDYAQLEKADFVCSL